MSKKNIIILVCSTLFLIFALIVFGYAMILKNRNSSNNTVVTPNTDETIYNSYFFDIDGEKFTLNDFADKPCVVFLWKSDNAKSYDMINLITKYYEEHKNTINFLSINVNEPDIDLQLLEHVKAVNFKIPIYFDTDLTLKEEFNYNVLPELIFMSKDGTIEKEITSEITEDTFLANLELLETE